VADVVFDAKFVDHLSGEEHFQIADAVIIEGIQGVCQAIIEILMGSDMWQDHIQHSGISGEAAKPIKLKDLKKNARNHGDASLAVGEDLPSGVKKNMFVNDLPNTTPVEIASQYGCEADALCLDGFQDNVWHNVLRSLLGDRTMPNTITHVQSDQSRLRRLFAYFLHFTTVYARIQPFLKINKICSSNKRNVSFNTPYFAILFSLTPKPVLVMLHCQKNKQSIILPTITPSIARSLAITLLKRKPPFTKPEFGKNFFGNSCCYADDERNRALTGETRR
jgi:hypothetical protein